ncbi:MAG TPA: hypothetical protein VHV30_00775, partial [Polyangiaceae bacterium]|nr:hypothetical protein [Polyangiaceae bacterium]
MSLASRLRRPHLRPKRVLASLAVTAAVGTALATSGACTDDTTTLPYTPITGIIIRSQALAAGIGCGTSTDGKPVIYRYVATLTYLPPDDAALPASCQSYSLANVFDCFADGAFENLPDQCGSTYNIDIYAYTFDGYAQAKLPASITCPPGVDACAPAPTSLSAAQRAAATWMTTCTGTQMSGSPVEATCQALALVGGVGGADAASGDAGASSSDADASESDAADGAPAPGDGSPADSAVPDAPRDPGTD